MAETGSVSAYVCLSALSPASHKAITSPGPSGSPRVGQATSVQRLCHRQHCTGEGVAGKVLLVPVSLSHGKGTHK
jgi:hypothetical protein